MDSSTYRDHDDLLSQVADSREEAENVRRILGAELNTPGMRNLNVPRISWGQVHEGNLDELERWKRAPLPIGATNQTHSHSAGTLVYLKRPACSRCDSGMTQCVTPAACECAEPARQKPKRGDLYRILVMATWPLYAVAVGAFFAWMLS